MNSNPPRWKSRFDLSAPCWNGYRALLEQLPGEVFPDAGALSSCLPPGALNRSGSTICFLPAAKLQGVDYERHIFETGQVSTRENNWHDLFNAMVWCRLPRLKATMNALHYEQLLLQKDGRRGRLRDALTLLDESGVLVSSSNIEVLNALACRDWDTAFVTCRESWAEETQVLVCGHAILEKFLNPYKSVTAHALLIQVPDRITDEDTDRLLASSLRKPGWLDSPACLSPLPLMGIPGWWTATKQDPSFYGDRDVFRLMSGRQSRAPVHVFGQS